MSVPVEAPVEHRKLRKPRSRERGLGHRQVVELLEALNRPELFRRCGGVYQLIVSRADLAVYLGISRQALGGRLLRLEKCGVLVDRCPITVDREQLLRAKLTREVPVPAEAGKSLQTRRSSDLVAEARQALTEAANRVGGFSRTTAAQKPIARAVSPEQPPLKSQQDDQLSVNLCYFIKSLLSTFDNLLMMIDNIKQSNQSSLSYQTLTSQRLIASPRARTREDYQTLTDQMFTPQTLTTPATNKKDSGCDQLTPRARQFESGTDMTLQNFEALVDEWVQSWPEDIAAKAPKPRVHLLFSVCRQYPQEWCYRALGLIARDMSDTNKIRNPGGLLYKAAREGWLSYFPEEPPQRCKYCDNGLVISSDEIRCTECALQARLKVEAAEKAAKEKARQEAEAAAEAEAAEKAAYDEEVAKGWPANEELIAKCGISIPALVKVALRRYQTNLLVPDDYVTSARMFMERGWIPTYPTEADSSEQAETDQPTPTSTPTDPTEQPPQLPQQQQGYTDGPQPLGAFLGDVMEQLAKTSGRSIQQPETNQEATSSQACSLDCSEIPPEEIPDG